MALPKKHLSVSQINCYLTCPAQYYFKYIQKVPQIPDEKLTRGKAVHKGIEYNLRQKIETRNDLPISEVLEYTVSEFEVFSQETEFLKKGKKEVQAETVSLVEYYQTKIAPKIFPLYVEERLELSFVNTEYTLLGFVDIVDEDYNIHDLKTSERKPADTVINDNLQLAAYALAFREMSGKKESQVSLDYLVSNKKGPAFYPLAKEITDNDINRFLLIMGHVAHNIENGNFYPNPCSMFCGASCQFFEECHSEWGTVAN